MKREGKSKKIRLSIQEYNLEFCNEHNIGLSELINSTVESLKEDIKRTPLKEGENIYNRSFTVDFQ